MWNGVDMAEKGIVCSKSIVNVLAILLTAYGLVKQGVHDGPHLGGSRLGTKAGQALAGPAKSTQKNQAFVPYSQTNI